MNIAEWLAATARVRPSAPALVSGTDVVADYARFARAAASVAAHLADGHGVGPGDRVGIYLANSPQYLEALFGVWWSGAVAVPVNHKLLGHEVAEILSDCGATALVTTAGEAQELTAAGVDQAMVTAPARSWQDAGPLAGGDPISRAMDDPAWIFYTSGTTGRPKGATLSHANLIAMSLCYLADIDPIAAGEAVLYAAPISHGAGLYGLVHVRMGSRHVVPSSARFDPDEVLDLAKTTRNVSMFAAPTMIRRLVDAARTRGVSGDGLKTVIYGGGPMYLADIQDALAVLGPRFVQIYGQGESPMTITALSRLDHSDTGNPRHLERLSSVGRAQSAVQVRVCTPDGRPLPAGEIGEVEVRGLTVMQGYWGNTVATKEAMHDGWLRTGDLGQVDHDGYLTLAGRSKDVVISGGTNIYPSEVEDTLVGHPDVQEAAVVGIPDRDWGEIVVAYVVGRDGRQVTAEDLDRHCLGLLARFKRPRRYRIVTELPKNHYGKVLKRALRAAELEE